MMCGSVLEVLGGGIENNRSGSRANVATSTTSTYVIALAVALLAIHVMRWNQVCGTINDPVMIGQPGRVVISGGVLREQMLHAST
jgi:hypothetical protein